MNSEMNVARYERNARFRYSEGGQFTTSLKALLKEATFPNPDSTAIVAILAFRWSGLASRDFACSNRYCCRKAAKPTPHCSFTARDTCLGDKLRISPSFATVSLGSRYSLRARIACSIPRHC